MVNDRLLDLRRLLHWSRGDRNRWDNCRCGRGWLTREVRLCQSRESPRQPQCGSRAHKRGQPDEPDRNVAHSPFRFLIHRVAHPPGGRVGVGVGEGRGLVDGRGDGDVVGRGEGDGDRRGEALARGEGDGVGDGAAAFGAAGAAGAAARGGGGSYTSTTLCCTGTGGNNVLAAICPFELL